MLSAVIWRNTYWSAKGSYGHAAGHENHSHLEFPGRPGQVLNPGDASYDECVVLGQWLQAQGFRVAEHPAFGTVHRVHTGRGHYDHRAIDVNFGPGGENDIEKRAFDALIPSVLHQGVDARALAAGIKQPQPQEDDLPGEDYFNLQFEDIKQRLVKLESDAEEKRVQGVSRLSGKLDQLLDAMRHLGGR